jgi:hypothetical protein
LVEAASDGAKPVVSRVSVCKLSDCSVAPSAFPTKPSVGSLMLALPMPEQAEQLRECVRSRLALDPVVDRLPDADSQQVDEVARHLSHSDC